MTAPCILLLILTAYQKVAPLTTAEEVRAVRHAPGTPPRPVRLHGTLTYFSAELKHLFVQDATGGVHVRLGGAEWPKWARTGDVVDVAGTTSDQPFTVAAA